jgi:hypothetical protein
MGQTMGLDGMEALEIEDGLHEAGAGRVAIIDRLDVNAHDRAPFRPVAQHLVEGLAQQDRLQIGMIEALADPVDHAILEGMMVEHGRVEEGGQQRIVIGGKPRFAAEAVPDRIHRLHVLSLEDFAFCGHCRSPRFLFEHII